MTPRPIVRLVFRLAAIVPPLLAMVPIASGQDLIPPPPTVEETPAAVESTPPVKEFDSPRTTVETFLSATDPSKPGGPELAVAAFVDDAISSTGAVRDQTLETFRTVLVRLGWGDETLEFALPGPGSVEGDSFTLFPWTNTRFGLIPDRSQALADLMPSDWSIELAKGEDGAWRFTSASVDPARLDAAISAFNRLRRESGEPPLETESIREWSEVNLPEWAIERFIGIAIWQWLGLAAVVFIGLFVDLVVRLTLFRFALGFTRRMYPGIDEPSVKRAVRSIGLVATAMTWTVLIPVLGLPLEAFAILEPAAKFALILAVFWLGWRATDLAGDIIGTHARSTDTKLDDILVPMVRKTAKVLLVVFALLNLAPMLGLNLGPLLAAVGVGTFGFAFAFKNSLENLFGSITVILDRPFNVGDWVVVENVEGTVEAVGLRSTRIRTFYNSLVTMPNANLITNQVDNYGMRKYRRWSTRLGVVYGTPVARIDAFCEAIRELVREHPYTRKDYYQVWLNEFGDSGMEVLVYVFWEAPDWQTELRERHRFMLDIIRVAERVGIDFSFPSRTLYLQRNPPPAAPADDRLDRDDPRSAMRAGREAVREIVENADWKDEVPPGYRFLSAEETARLDAIGDETRAAEIERRLGRREQAGLPSQSGDDPERPDFTEQREAGG